jgi:predicted RNase H-related nuclease YkuK (DUF458 family)
MKEVAYKKMGCGTKVMVDDYVVSLLDRNPNVELHIGTDSQNYSRHTVYVTTVVFRYRKQGAHVIYNRERVPKINDLWTRLWTELERSTQIALFLKNDLGIDIHQIDLDYNDNPRYASYKLKKAAMGYVESLGFKAKTKPNLLLATGAANVLCH